MKLTVNGEAREVLDGMTVADLLAYLRISAGRIAVEVNVEVVRWAQHQSRRLQDGDRVEIVTFVGGG